MVGTIIYVVNVKRTTQNSGGRGLLLVHVASYVAGAAATGAVFGLAGYGLKMLSFELTILGGLLLLALFGLILSLREMDIYRVPLPITYRQVPARWRSTLPAIVMSTLFGLELGMGLSTHVLASTFFVPLVGALIIGDPMWGTVIMGGFGVGRATSLFLVNHLTTDTNQLTADVGYLDGWKPIVHLVNGLLLCMVSGVFLGFWLGSLA